jgi:hypothetical protein
MSATLPDRAGLAGAAVTADAMHGPRVMASLRNLVITTLRLTGETSIAAALRHHARRPGSHCKRS